MQNEITNLTLYWQKTYLFFTMLPYNVNCEVNLKCIRLNEKLRRYYV